VLIVTDGAVDLPDDLLGSDLIVQVPGEIVGPKGPLVADREEFWAGLRRGQYPSTRPPTVSALMSAYQHPDLVIGLHVSGQLSVTVQRALQAAQRVGSHVSVIDTGSLSVGAGLIVSEVQQAASSETAPSLVDLARSLPSRLHTFALIQDVDALRRSERSGLVPSSHLARNHPLLLAVRGRVVPLAQLKQRSGALTELARHLRHRPGPDPYAWALGHGEASDVDSVVSELSTVMETDPAFVTYLAATVGAHLGPESLVVGVLSDPVIF
jgi:DegV family protein with EDD domain